MEEMNNKILSIIIPSYNMEAYLPQCIESLLIPEIDKLDIIIVNDGSKDRTSEIAHSFADKFPNSIRVIDKKNGNYGSCINRGIQEANGKYVKILDADDSFYTQNFGEFIRFIQIIDADLIITDYNMVDENGNVSKNFKFNALPVNTIFKISQLLELIQLASFQMHSITYKLSNLRQLEYIQTEGISYTDQEWIFEPFANVESVCYFNKSVYKYLIGREGQTMSKSFNEQVKTLCHIANIAIDRYVRLNNSAKNRDSQLKYLTLRLTYFLETIYRMGILNEVQSDVAKKLKALDCRLALDIPSVYKSLDGYVLNKKLPVKIIRCWRKNYSLDALKIRVIRQVYNVLH